MIVFIFEDIIKMKIGVTVIKYRIRYDIQIDGLLARIIIHPRWLIEE